MESQQTRWMAFSVFSLVFGMVAGHYIGQAYTGTTADPFRQQPVPTMSTEAQTLVLDALQAQATLRATDSKLDAAQQETIRLLIPSKVAELRARRLSEADLSAIASIYRLIEQPNGLRATRDGSMHLPAGTLIESNDGGNTGRIVGTRP